MSEPVTQPPVVTFSYRLSREDWDAFLRAAEARTDAGQPRLAMFLVGGGLGLLYLAVEVIAGPEVAGFGILLGLALGVGGVAAWVRRGQKRLTPAADGQFYRQRTITLDQDGVRFRSDGYMMALSWSAVPAVSRTADHVFLWLDRNTAEMIPVNQLPTDLDADTLVRAIEGWSGLPCSQES